MCGAAELWPETVAAAGCRTEFTTAGFSPGAAPRSNGTHADRSRIIPNEIGNFMMRAPRRLKIDNPMLY
ncbi:hypothetical protein SDC9_158836 [bioreactor metagenome]|uniref:Uncharacterized protein n=1 Tax=bioreactor metagenome TaxID=1076179 RepID=A0A645FGX2_9ZZZZ